MPQNYEKLETQIVYYFLFEKKRWFSKKFEMMHDTGGDLGMKMLDGSSFPEAYIWTDQVRMEGRLFQRNNRVVETRGK